MQVWINADDPKNVAAIGEALEKAVKANQSKQLKGFLIFIKPNGRSVQSLSSDMKNLAADKKLDGLGLAYVSGPRDEGVSLYKINTDEKVKNTIFVYRDKTLAAKLVNLLADDKGLAALDSAIQQVLK